MISKKYYLFSYISICGLLATPERAMEPQGLHNLLMAHEVSAQQYDQAKKDQQHRMRWLSYSAATAAAITTSALLLPKSVENNHLLSSSFIAAQMGLAGYFSKKGCDKLLSSVIIPRLPSMRASKQQRSVLVQRILQETHNPSPQTDVNHIIRRFRERNEHGEHDEAARIADTQRTRDLWPDLNEYIRSYQPKPLTQRTQQLLRDITPHASENSFGIYDQQALKYQQAYQQASDRFRWPRRIAYCIPVITALIKLMHNYYEIRNSLDVNPQQGITTLVNIFSPITVTITAINFAFLGIGPYLFPSVDKAWLRQRRQAREIERLCKFHRYTSDDIQRIRLPEGCLQVTTDLKESLRVRAPQPTRS